MMAQNGPTVISFRSPQGWRIDRLLALAHGITHGRRIIDIVRTPTIYLITAEPERPGSQYWGKDGTKVGNPLAAEFYTFEEAKEFARKHGIVIDGVFNRVVVK